ncbi:MAG: monovalent cation/H(+) antiporter subunit G [Alphaproteobacteria bacterium]|nr:monovalent cation/H(+) antiporter subunit G [Alphaproteobacteria bacterium]MCW5750444.1 monovalent cation/H(+) antiporter subunit G [Alphaproteobacteria bacterium]
MIDLLIAFLLLSGSAFALVAAIGIVRMPDLFIRMHAASKAGTLGAGLILLGVAVLANDASVSVRAVIAIVFIMLTAPIAAHLLGRAAYKTGVPLWQKSELDEWNAREEK